MLKAISLRPANRTDLAVTVTRQEGVENINLSEVEYDVQEAVDAAREAITRMDTLERFVDWAFASNNREVREAIADKVLSENAAIWQRGNPGKHPVAGVDRGTGLAAKARIVSLLSPQGRDVIVAVHPLQANASGELPRFSPFTGGNPEVDQLLGMVFPLDETAEMLEDRGDFCDAGKFWMAHGSGRRAALAYETSAKYLQAGNADTHAAQAWRDVGDAWVSTRRQYDAAASAYENAAAIFRSLGEFDSAAYAWVQAGDARFADESYDAAALAYESAAELFVTVGLQGDAALASSLAEFANIRINSYGAAAAAHEEAEVICAAARPPDGLPNVWMRIGHAWERDGNEGNALVAYRRAASLFESGVRQGGVTSSQTPDASGRKDIPDHDGTAVAHENIGRIHAAAERHDDAAMAWMRAGRAWIAGRHHDHAAWAYQHAAGIFQGHGHRRSAAEALTDAGRVLTAFGSAGEAAGVYEKAAAIFQADNHHAEAATATAWMLAGRARIASHGSAGAVLAYENAATNYQMAGRRNGEADAWVQAGHARILAFAAGADVSQFRAAATAQENAASIFQADGQHGSAASAWTQAGHAWDARGEYGYAAVAYEKAARSSYAAGRRLDEADGWTQAGNAWGRAHDYVARAIAMEKAAAAYQAMTDQRASEAKSWMQAGTAWANVRNHEAAAMAYEKAAAAFPTSTSREEAWAREACGNAWLAAGRVDFAVKSWKAAIATSLRCGYQAQATSIADKLSSHLAVVMEGDGPRG